MLVHMINIVCVLFGSYLILHVCTRMCAWTWTRGTVMAIINVQHGSLYETRNTQRAESSNKSAHYPIWYLRIHGSRYSIDPCVISDIYFTFHQIHRYGFGIIGPAREESSVRDRFPPQRNCNAEL